MRRQKAIIGIDYEPANLLSEGVNGMVGVNIVILELTRVHVPIRSGGIEKPASLCFLNYWMILSEALWLVFILIDRLYSTQAV